MGWALVSLVLVAIGGGYLLSTVRAISEARNETDHYRLSIRFWAGLAVLGTLMVGLFAGPVIGHAWMGSDVGRLTVVLMSVLPSVVIFSGVRNAVSLWRASRRRRGALQGGVPLAGRVIARGRRVLAQDLMRVVVEADVPSTTPSPELGYRPRDPDRATRQRFVETCPSDHWKRFEPGAEIVIRVVPGRPEQFAVELFPDPT